MCVLFVCGTVEMEGHVFKNWAETHSCHPELYFEPQNHQELRQVEHLAASRITVLSYTVAQKLQPTTFLIAYVLKTPK